jgi:proline iminopeptidase
MRARIRDTEIYFDVDGAALVPDGKSMRDRPTAFLVHGGPGVDHSSLKSRYGRLAEKMQLVYFDHRGQGRSARGDPKTYTLDENVEDMEALRRFLGLTEIVSLGTSYGGIVAMAHAARYPMAVSKLILVATSAHGGNIPRAREIVAIRGTPEQIAQYEDLLAGRLDSSEKLRRYFEIMGPLYARKDDPALSTQGLSRAILSPEALNSAFGPTGFLHNYDLRPELGAINAPTLILAGRYDWICAPEFSQEIHQLIADSDLRIFEDSGHSIGGDEPQNFFDAVAGFLVHKARTVAASELISAANKLDFAHESN